MAQPIYCDMPECSDPDAPRARIAVWMVQALDGSTVEAWCAVHWPIAAVTYADAGATALGSSLAELLGGSPPGPDDPTDSDEPDAPEAATFQDAPPGAEAAQEPDQGAGDGTTPEAPVPATLEVGQPSRVVKRGTSPSRRAHEARKRSRKAAPATMEEVAAQAFGEGEGGEPEPD